MSDPKRAALEAQIAALEAQLASEDAAPVEAEPTVTPAAPAVAAGTPAKPAVAVDTSPEALAKRHTPLVAAKPSPMFMRSAVPQAQMSRSPGVFSRARPAPEAAAPAVAPVAAAPAAASSAPLANRQRPIVRPTAAPKQLPRVTMAGLPRPAQARTAPGSSYMRGKPRT
jgi:hypothetical protein